MIFEQYLLDIINQIFPLLKSQWYLQHDLDVIVYLFFARAIFKFILENLRKSHLNIPNQYSLAIEISEVFAKWVITLPALAFFYFYLKHMCR